MAEWGNGGGMAKWGGKAEWQNGGMAEWRNGGMGTAELDERLHTRST